MYSEYKDSFICSLHDGIAKICNKYIRKIKKDDYDELNKEITIKISDLLEILELAKSAKIKGKHMEKRLIKYYSGIVSMGFTRNKAKK